jgi:hypothetical protein
MNFRQYKNDGGPKICPTLRAMLTETGEHMFRLAFDCEPETKRNFFFGVVATHDTTVKDECQWIPLETSRLCVYLCYELCDAFPLHVDSKEYTKLQQAVERILEVRVCLLPFTHFKRSIGIYPALHDIFRDSKFSAIFRDDRNSPYDLKMHVVLSRWQRAPFLLPVEPPALISTGSTVDENTNAIPRGEWNTCFQCLARVYWYHAYVYDVIGVDFSDGFSRSNVMRMCDMLCANGDKDMHGKLALLDVLKLAYKSNYKVA